MGRKAKKLWGFTLSFVLLTLTACSPKGKSVVPPKEDGGEYVYVPYYENMGDNDWLGDVYFQDGALYYRKSDYGGDHGATTDSIYKRDLTEQTAEEILYSQTYNAEANMEYLREFALLPEGKIVLLYSSYAEEKEQLFLKIIDKNGVENLNANISKTVNSETEPVLFDSLLADAEGNIYLKSESTIFVYDLTGRFLFRLDAKEKRFLSMGKTGDGTVFAAQSVGSSVELCSIDIKKKDYGKSCQNIPANLSGNAHAILPGLTKDVLLWTTTGLVEYDFESQSYEEVLNWIDCDILSDYVSAVGTTQDGQVIALIREWKDNAPNWICTLTKTRKEDVSPKQVVTMGTSGLSQELENAIVNFNKTNGIYRISVMDCSKDVDFSEANSYNNMLTEFNRDILTGNAPDLIDLSMVNYVQYMNKGILEDLYPYLQKSSVVKTEDLNSSVLQAYSVNGKLPCIPSAVTISTLVMKATDAGEKTGWSVSNLIALFNENLADSMIMQRMSKEDILYLCVCMNEADYIDWETGECRFDSEEFKELLEFANRFPSTINWENPPSIVQWISDGKLSLTDADISRIPDIQLYDKMYQGDFLFIGYPTADGSNGSMFQGRDTYGIYAKSKQKEGAWAFLETLLTADYQCNLLYGLPSLNSAYDQMLARHMEKQYIRDEEGNLIFDEEGNPAEYPLFPLLYGDFMEEADIVTEEEAAKLTELFHNTNKVSGQGTRELMNLILEEAAPYFAGQKTLEESTEVIQGRVSMYILEEINKEVYSP